MKKHNSPEKDCEKCGVRLMNKEVRFCTSCGCANAKRIKTNLIIFTIGAAVVGSGLMFLAEYFKLPLIWMLLLLFFILAVIPVSMKKIRKM